MWMFLCSSILLFLPILFAWVGQMGRPNSEVTWQVDMDGMSHIFSSFISFLQLDDAYNIIILNPKRNSTHTNYGYR